MTLTKLKSSAALLALLGLTACAIASPPPSVTVSWDSGYTMLNNDGIANHTFDQFIGGGSPYVDALDFDNITTNIVNTLTGSNLSIVPATIIVSGGGFGFPVGNYNTGVGALATFMGNGLQGGSGRGSLGFDLNNLTVGTAYEIQFFSTSTAESLTGTTKGPASSGPAWFATGTFVASAPIEAFYVTGGNNNDANFVLVTPVPEPATLALAAAGLAGLLALRRKK